MKFLIKGELAILIDLIEVMRLRMEAEDAPGTVWVELVDDAHNGNSVYFEVEKPSSRVGVRVQFMPWRKEEFAFRLRYRGDTAFAEDTCVFPIVETERGVNATASFLKDRLLCRDIPDFQRYFEKEPA